MNPRRKQTDPNTLLTHRHIRCRIALPLLLALLFFSCDHPTMVVTPANENDQLISVTDAAGFGERGSTPVLGNSFNKSPRSDSSLTITYSRFENASDSAVDTLVTFVFSLYHKLSGDTTLDYGNVEFADVQIIEQDNAWEGQRSWQYTSQILNGQLNGVYSSWSEACNLEQNPVLSVSQSHHVKDFTQVLHTTPPNRIANLDAGSLLSASSDLEIIFQRPLPKGALITIGSDSSKKYYRFELLRPASRVVIPAKYLSEVKKTFAAAKCRIFYEEQLFIGELVSQAITGQQEFRLPMYEITQQSITAILIE